MSSTWISVVADRCSWSNRRRTASDPDDERCPGIAGDLVAGQTYRATVLVDTSDPCPPQLRIPVTVRMM